MENGEKIKIEDFDAKFGEEVNKRVKELMQDNAFMQKIENEYSKITNKKQLKRYLKNAKKFSKIEVNAKALIKAKEEQNV